VSAPTGWTTPADIKGELLRHWNRGSMLAGATRFPLELRLRRPDARALAERFDEVRAWIRALDGGSRTALGYGYDIAWSEINHRQLGRNLVPSGITVPSEQDALRLLGKRGEAERFRALAAATLASFPDLGDWVARKPLTVLDQAAEWERVLAVLRWFRAHPRSGLYLRQLDIAGVDSKFIEARKGLLAELLDRILPAEAVDEAATGARSFERRYGLRTKPAQIRFRLLDERLRIAGLADLAVPAAEFAALSLPVERVFVTENEVNGLAFPAVPRSLVVFGLGYGVDRLGEIGWLRRAALHYWGDIDTHGFAMLDRLRGALPDARSFLMDRETLLAHRDLWGREPEPHPGPLDRLDPAERALFDELRRDALGERVRLEQERISFGRVEQALQAFADR
jgi:hypothetical protein